MLISALELSDAIQEILEEASAELKKRINEEAETIAEQTAEALQKESPRLKIKRKGLTKGAYARSWEVVKKENPVTGNNHFVVRNKKHYRLTHLLEHGHANRNGGRTSAQPHITKINDASCAEFERKVVEAINEM